MGLDAAGYARIVRQLLPPGKLWSTALDSVLEAILLATGDALVRVDERGQALSWESDARYATELLPEFEEEYGFEADGTLAERRARVYARELAEPRVRPVDFQVALAPLLGQASVDVVVIESTAAQALLSGHPEEIYRFFIHRDPTLPGTYDVVGAQALLDDLSHSHTQGHVIESIDFMCDDEFSLCDSDLLGA